MVSSIELALVVVEHPTKVLEYLIEVPDSDGVIEVDEELPIEGNQEELIIRDEWTKAKEKRQAQSPKLGHP